MLLKCYNGEIKAFFLFLCTMQNRNFVKMLLIAIGAAILFIPYLGSVHLFDWDEVNFAECAREMLLTNNYLRVQVDFKPFWEKPPVFIWMQALSMHCFGINEFAARLPNALMGIVTLCTLFYIGKRVHSERVAWWWVLLYAGSWLPGFYFKTAIIDPTFNFFILIAFFQIYLVKVGERKRLHALLSGLFLGLAVLTKGPVAILVALLSLAVYVVINKGLWGYKWTHLVLIIMACAVTTFSWFGIDIFQNGWWFTKEFITYQIRLFQTEDAGHGGPFFYHFLVLLIGCFPAAAYLFQYRRSEKRALNLSSEELAFSQWMRILFWVVLILFSIVKTKIVHYSSLCYFPLTYIAALQVARIDEGKIKLKRRVWLINLITGVLIAVLIMVMPLAGTNVQALIPYIKDQFAVANLAANVNWHVAEAGIGLAYILLLILAFVYIRKSFAKGMLMLIALQIMIMQVAMLHFVPKVEAYSQRAAISFYKSMAGKDVYVATLGFKSYAFLFYSQKQNNSHPDYYRYGTEWLLNGLVDKPCYFISKNTEEQKWLSYPNLEKVGEQNGFVFYRRK